MPFASKGTIISIIVFDFFTIIMYLILVYYLASIALEISINFI
jgi:hypothetical protein